MQVPSNSTRSSEGAEQLGTSTVSQSPFTDTRKRKAEPADSNVKEDNLEQVAMRTDARKKLNIGTAETSRPAAHATQPPAKTTASSPTDPNALQPGHQQPPMVNSHQQPPMPSMASLWGANEILRVQLQASRAEVRAYEEKVPGLIGRVMWAEAGYGQERFWRMNAEQAAANAISWVKGVQQRVTDAEEEINGLRERLTKAEAAAADAERRLASSKRLRAALKGKKTAVPILPPSPPPGPSASVPECFRGSNTNKH